MAIAQGWGLACARKANLACMLLVNCDMGGRPRPPIDLGEKTRLFGNIALVGKRNCRIDFSITRAKSELKGRTAAR